MSKLPTGPYKGVRDFYPEDMAIQRYIFDTWSRTVESFGYQRYDASILEPATLYKAKGAENEEMVNEQTYTFTDRGEREVTLRPEMTPTVARMVAARQRELTPPIRWYSIPNLFRYERTQRGRLREHWQLNCDIFGVDDMAADVEIIALAHQLLLNFGATPDMFEIRINNRAFMESWYSTQGISEAGIRSKITKLNDRKNKISDEEYKSELRNIIVQPFDIDTLQAGLESNDISQISSQEPFRSLFENLQELGLDNIIFDKTLARGFDYYTGTVFEIFDKHPGGTKRSMLGGGRYDNLTGLFSDTPLSGVGFGMGDVTMRDFLETHNLLPPSVSTTAPLLTIIPLSPDEHQPAQALAQQFRAGGITTSIDFSARKRDKKFKTATDTGVHYVIVLGPDEIVAATLTLQDLRSNHEQTGATKEIITFLTEN